MTEKRHKYTDSYNPVVELPSRTPKFDKEKANFKEEKDNIATLKPKKPGGPKGHRVKNGSRNRSSVNPSEPGAAKGSKTEKSNLSYSKIKEFLTGQTMRWLAGIVLGGLAIYLLVAFISYFANCMSDQAAILNSPVGSLPPVGNTAGEGGARLSEFLINGSFGLGSFVIIVWLGAISLKILSGWPRFRTVNFTIKCIVALITISLIIGLLTIASDTPVNWGGYHGRYVNEYIIGFCGWIGAVIICLIFVALFFIICLRDFINWILRKKHEIAVRRLEAQRKREEQEALERELAEMRAREEIDAIKAGEASSNVQNDEDDNDRTVLFSGKEVEIDPSFQGYDLDDEPNEPKVHVTDYAMQNPEDYGETNTLEENSGITDSADTHDSDDPDAFSDKLSHETDDSSIYHENSQEGELSTSGKPASDETSSASGEQIRESGEKMVVNVNQIAKAENIPSESFNQPLVKKYKFPSPDLLREGVHKVTVDVAEQQENKERIRETLLYHKIPITSISATVGPTVTLYEIRPEQGVKIARIKNLADDIALSLAAKGVRVIAPIPGKGTVGIEVANADPQTVAIRTILESRKYAETRYRLPVALGSTIGNDVYIADLTKMPHLLVAGATGQGKSVGLNVIISSLLYKKRPDELKFVMIDPKEVEFSLYAKIESHYLAKLEDSDAIVTDMSKVVPTLLSLCVEMDNRYKLLRTAKVRNIEEYNAKMERNKLNPNEGHRFLPYIVLVVDEFGDLIMTSGKEVENPIIRLVQKARAIGIHVILATQRPSTNVITGIIKANFPVRIAFRVSSGVDSKTILDATGAQQLIGKGDMLISNNSEVVRVQCAFIDTPEVEEICNYIERQPFNSGAYILPDPEIAMGEEGLPGGGPEALDPLFEEVAEMVVTSGYGSTSNVQRRMSIGYNRAGKIMDQLEHYGVVGPSVGGKPRSVLIDMYALQELLKNLK